MAVSRADVTEIVNNSLKTLGYSDYSVLATGTDAEILASWNAIGALPEDALSAILKQIASIQVFRNYGIMFNAEDNPIRRFFRDDINAGGGEEDIYHKIIAPVEGIWARDFAGLDAAGTRAKAEDVAAALVTFYQTDVAKKFHTRKQRFDVPCSLTEHEIRQAFTPDGMTRFIDTTLANMQWSAEVALLDLVIADVKAMIEAGATVVETGVDLNTPNGVTEHVERLRTITDAMMMPSTAFNKAEVRTKSSPEDVFLFCTPEYINRLQTRGYANAINIEYYRNNNALVILPYGSDLGTITVADDEDGHDEKVLAALIDRRAIVESIMYWAVKPFDVPNTDYINYFLKVEDLSGYNEFFNAVAFSGSDIGTFNPALPVTASGSMDVNVTNDPLNVNVTKGEGALV